MRPKQKNILHTIKNSNFSFYVSYIPKNEQHQRSHYSFSTGAYPMNKIS